MRLRSKYIFIKKLLYDFITTLVGTSEYNLNSKSFITDAYFMDYSFALKNEAKHYNPKDVNGIPLSNYLNSGKSYNPTRIASFCLAQFQRFLVEGAIVNKKIFLKVADWFTRFDDGKFIYTIPYGELTPPWMSCMSQGQGISVLVRAYNLTKEEKYLKIAKKAIIPFIEDIDKGGLRSKIENKFDFLEEFPFKKPRHVLNGFIYAIVGIYELSLVSEDVEKKVKLDNLVKSASNFNLWCSDNWSTYDLHKSTKGRRNTATIIYQNVHITQFKYLEKIFPGYDFGDFASRLEQYYKNIFLRFNALKNKILYRIDQPAERF
jgi:heparosan-N-sulfate-glucuronate 5-epimerase